MSTEVTHPPGAILTRKDKQGDPNDELVVTGAGKEIVVTSNLEFGGSFTLPPEVAFREYDLTIPEGLVLPNSQKEYAGLSPEERFRHNEQLDMAARGAKEAAINDKVTQEANAAAAEVEKKKTTRRRATNN